VRQFAFFAPMAWAAPTDPPPLARSAAAPGVAASAPAAPASAGAAGSPPEQPAFAQFGFAPALYAVRYNRPVLGDSKDVRLRGDGTLTAGGSRMATYMGVELHYGASAFNKAVTDPVTGKIVSTRGHSFSPFVGLFDIDGGINGLALGAVYSYWNGDKDYGKKSALNIGIGWTLHRNRLVLSDAVREGEAPRTGLTADDYTQRKDVRGVTVMVSSSFGF
jgi:hypothetical protein